MVIAQLTLEEVLTRGIQKEIESQHLYAHLGQGVKEPAVKDAFRDLARQERGHQAMLEQYLRGEFKEGALRHEQRIDYKIAEKLDQPPLTPDMKLPDVFNLAAHREKLSHEFYLGLAEVHPSGKVRTLLEALAAQELEHKHRVEFLYTEVAFPQTDGG